MLLFCDKNLVFQISFQNSENWRIFPKIEGHYSGNKFVFLLISMLIYFQTKKCQRFSKYRQESL